MADFVLKKTRDIGDLITDTFTYIRLNFKSYGLSLLYFMVPVLLLSSIIVGSSYGNLFSTALSNDFGETVPDEMLGFSLGFFVGLIMTMFAIAILMVITYNHIRFRFEGKSDIQPFDLVQNAVSKIIGLFFLNIVYVSIILFGLVFFILPGIYFAIRLSLSSTVYIVEDVDIFTALGRSWELIDGYWWMTFGVIVIMSIISNIISSVFTVPIMIATLIIGAAGAEDGGTIALVIGVFYSLTVTVSTLFTAIPLLTNALHYFNLSERKEGSGLRSRIESLGL